MMEAWKQSVVQAADDPFEGQMVVALAEAYEIVYKENLLWTRMVTIEKHISHPLINLDTGRKSPKYFLNGYVDKLFRSGDSWVIMDHKTTSEHVADPNSRYWRRLASDPQPTIYMLLCLAEGYSVEGIVWDVVKKPAIRPRQLNKAEIDILKEKDNLDEIAPRDGEYASGEPKRREGPWLYGRRVFEWAMVNAEEVFVRQHVSRDEKDVYDLNQSLWDLTRVWQQLGRMDCWPQNTRSCNSYGRECEYSQICFDGEDPLFRGLYVSGDKQPGTMSHSSVGTFFECPRKYKHRYIDNITLSTQEDTESLRIGSLWHLAMDGLYRHYAEGEKDE